MIIASSVHSLSSSLDVLLVAGEEHRGVTSTVKAVAVELSAPFDTLGGAGSDAERDVGGLFELGGRPAVVDVPARVDALGCPGGRSGGGGFGDAQCSKVFL
jgi:hypothetical protein